MKVIQLGHYSASVLESVSGSSNKVACLSFGLTLLISFICSQPIYKWFLSPSSYGINSVTSPSTLRILSLFSSLSYAMRWLQPCRPSIVREMSFHYFIMLNLILRPILYLYSNLETATRQASNWALFCSTQ